MDNTCSSKLSIFRVNNKEQDFNDDLKIQSKVFVRKNILSSI